jgi:peptidoglycan hydrolase CwlO-like protein
MKRSLLAATAVAFALVSSSAGATTGSSLSTQPHNAANIGYDQVQLLESQNKALTKRVAKLESEVEKLQGDMTSLRNLTHPRGLSRMLITKANFDKVDGAAVMEFWVKE